MQTPSLGTRVAVLMTRSMSSGPEVPRVMVAVSRLENVDRLMREFSEVGFEAAPAFSGAEVIATLAARPFDAVILDTGLEDHESVRRWIDRHRRGVMCVIHDFEAPVPGDLDVDDAPMIFASDPHTFEVTGRVLHAVARARSGRSGTN